MITVKVEEFLEDRQVSAFVDVDMDEEETCVYRLEIDEGHHTEKELNQIIAMLRKAKSIRKTSKL